jgi:hypothetical protein
VHTNKSCWEGGGVSEICLYSGCTPITQEIGGIHARTDNAAYFITFVQSTSNNLATEGTSASNNKKRVLRNGGARAELGSAVSSTNHAPLLTLRRDGWCRDCKTRNKDRDGK